MAWSCHGELLCQAAVLSEEIQVKRRFPQPLSTYARAASLNVVNCVKVVFEAHQRYRIIVCISTIQNRSSGRKYHHISIIAHTSTTSRISSALDLSQATIPQHLQSLIALNLPHRGLDLVLRADPVPEFLGL